jgi:RsiW-degrading membrane proteinase PrsW (M82 family)
MQLWNIPYDISSYLDKPSSYLLVYLTMVTGVVEEFFKLVPYVFIIKFFTNFDETLDSIVYASVIALGFSSYENLLHLKYLSGIELYARAIASPLTHTIFSSIWGYYIYKFITEKKRSFAIPITAFIFASVAHGLYDYFLFTPLLRILSSVLILGIWLWRIIVIEKLQKKYTNYKRSKV